MRGGRGGVLIERRHDILELRRETADLLGIRRGRGLQFGDLLIEQVGLVAGASIFLRVNAGFTTAMILSRLLSTRLPTVIHGTGM